MIDLYKDLECAKKGREIWLEIKEKYSFEPESGCLVLMPSADKQLNQAAMRHLPHYMERKYLDKAVVICMEEKLLIEEMQKGKPAEENNTAGRTRQIITVQLEADKIAQLLKYYRLIQFTKNIVVVSLEEPFGNANIIGREGITLENYVVDALYV